MGRGYSREQYLTRVAALRAALPQVCLGGDIIVGFPGEPEADFTQSLSLLEEVGYDFLFSFKYSDRPFTRASGLADHVEDSVTSERLQRLLELQRAISLRRHQEMQGRVVEVLVEGPAKKGQGLYSGRERGGRVVNFPGGPELERRLVQVRITQGLVNSLRGRLNQAQGGGES
jgi:tRNA-2-methylthio-N6-dimethylallyladenosine synthase